MARLRPQAPVFRVMPGRRRRQPKPANGRAGSTSWSALVWIRICASPQRSPPLCGVPSGCVCWWSASGGDAERAGSPPLGHREDRSGAASAARPPVSPGDCAGRGWRSGKKRPDRCPAKVQQGGMMTPGKLRRRHHRGDRHIGQSLQYGRCRRCGMAVMTATHSCGQPRLHPATAQRRALMRA